MCGDKTSAKIAYFSNLKVFSGASLVFVCISPLISLSSLLISWAPSISDVKYSDYLGEKS